MSFVPGIDFQHKELIPLCLIHAMALGFPELLNSLTCSVQPWHFRQAGRVQSVTLAQWSRSVGKDCRSCSCRMIPLSRSHGCIFTSAWQILLGARQKPYKTTACSFAWIAALGRMEQGLARTAFLLKGQFHCRGSICSSQA